MLPLFNTSTCPHVLFMTECRIFAQALHVRAKQEAIFITDSADNFEGLGGSLRALSSSFQRPNPMNVLIFKHGAGP